MSALDYGYGSYSDSIGGNATGRKKTSIFFDSCKALCAGQIAAGVIVATLSQRYLFDEIYFLGMIVGSILVIAGAIGIYGNVTKSRDILNFHIVVAILGIVMSSQFVGQVWRNVNVDCALAELFLKTNALDDLTQTLAQHDLFSSVHDRLEELEDMVNVVEIGMSGTMHYLKENPTGDPARQERDYIKSKLEIIRHHAGQVVAEIHAGQNATEGHWHDLSSEERRRIEQKLETAQNILLRIKKHDESELEHAFTPTEYEQMLMALIRIMKMQTGGNQFEDFQHRDLKALADQLESTKGVINKVSEGVDMLENLHEDTSYMSEKNKKNREKYRQEYLDMLTMSRQKASKDIGAYALHYMPEHCVKEQRGITYVAYLGLLIVALLLSSVYICLCVSFRIPVKTE